MTNSTIALIRHGHTNYTNIYPDLTPQGIDAVLSTGNSMKEYISKFQRVIAVSSPAIRAQGTGRILLDSLGLNNVKIRKIKSVENLKIKNLEDFLRYSSENSTSIYGELWLTDELLSNDNDLTESRKNVESRSKRFLRHYTDLLHKISLNDNTSTLLIVFTHFEIATNFLKAIYTNDESFPVHDYPVIDYAESVLIELINPEKSIYKISARGQEVVCEYEYIHNKFISES